ncbi:hypothetical protein [Pseudogemmobacter sonorensis]|uniref:hypothetical protein n=1 Tax=Pseudogemmobacter sonorensis TaxID=2989681 RepID=UPI003682AF7C
MRPLSQVTLPAAIVLSLVQIPQGALAQGVTAAELWSSWQEAVASTGGALSAEERREGNQLILDALVFKPEADEETAFRIDTLTLVSQVDGSVGVVLPETFPLRVDLAGTRGETAPGQLVFSITAPDLGVTIIGLGERAEFQAIGPSVSVTLDGIAPPAPGGEEITLAATVENLELRYKHDLAVALPSVEAALTLGTAELTARAVSGPERHTEVTSGIESLSLFAAAAFPPSTSDLTRSATQGGSTPPVAPLLTALADGLLLDLRLSLGPSNLHADMVEPGREPGRARFDLGSGAASLKLDQTVLAWSAAMTDFLMTGPVPDIDGAETMVEVSLGEYRNVISLGLNGFAGSQDWAFAHLLRDLAFDDAGWADLDPTGMLPNTPLTLAFDMDGRYGLDPAALEPGWQPDPRAPHPLRDFSFDINELAFSGLDLSVTGTGGLGFDFRDLVTFDGVPAPAGRLQFVTRGAYALIDRLSGAALISEAEATQARQALLLIGQAGEDEDTLATDVDFRDKALYLNGQRIR